MYGDDRKRHPDMLTNHDHKNKQELTLSHKKVKSIKSELISNALIARCDRDYRGNGNSTVTIRLSLKLAESPVALLCKKCT